MQCRLERTKSRPLNLGDFHGFSMTFVDFRGLSWTLVDFRGLSWTFVEVPLFMVVFVFFRCF